uniref:Uncharacterized protein n=1 Tax=Globisporangium ultimum (strain ATCC 200006 / CBS 805.95 / DAOM BR144) TaxID=431595 RepID=K3X8S4_GLOUD
YLDVVVEDIKRESVKPTNRGFGFRQVHSKLSVPHLNHLLEMEPTLFRDNIKFAVRGVQLLQAEAEDSKKELLDRRDSTQNTKELEHLSACLAFTSVFSGRLNGLRLILLYQKLLLLQCRHWRDPTDSILLQTLLEYIQLPRSYAGSMFPMARCMIKTGQGNPLEWSKHLPQQENNYLAKLSSSSELAFCDSSPTYFGPGDELVIHIRARNIKHVTAHLYEFRSADYYSRFRKEIPGSINVDGLLPNDEQHIDLSHFHGFQFRFREPGPNVESSLSKCLKMGKLAALFSEKGFYDTLNGSR